MMTKHAEGARGTRCNGKQVVKELESKCQRMYRQRDDPRHTGRNYRHDAWGRPR